MSDNLTQLSEAIAVLQDFGFGISFSIDSKTMRSATGESMAFAYDVKLECRAMVAANEFSPLFLQMLSDGIALREDRMQKSPKPIAQRRRFDFR